MPPSRALRPAAPDRHPAAEAAFQTWVADLEKGLELQRRARPELTFSEEPPPRRLAPYAAAVAATVETGDAEIGWGRFVLLCDPAGQPGWEGSLRIIAYLRCDLEPEIAADPLIGQVGWSWLTEALDARAAGYAAPSGTVTRVVTEGFGQKQGEPLATEFELRASWSPVPAGPDRPELDRHVSAWSDALCIAAGLPPAVQGVAALRQPGPRRAP